MFDANPVLAERNFAILKEQNPELVQAAQRGHSVIDPETGLPQTNRRSMRGMSLDVNAIRDDSPDEKATVHHKQ